MQAQSQEKSEQIISLTQKITSVNEQHQKLQ